MQGYEIKFNVYAETKDEADAAAETIKKFISEYAAQGVAVTAVRVRTATEKWKNNPFVFKYFR